MHALESVRPAWSRIVCSHQNEGLPCNETLGDKRKRHHWQSFTCTMIFIISGLVRNELKQKSRDRSWKSSNPICTVPCFRAAHFRNRRVVHQQLPGSANREERLNGAPAFGARGSSSKALEVWHKIILRSLSPAQVQLKIEVVPLCRARPT